MLCKINKNSTTYSLNVDTASWKSKYEVLPSGCIQACNSEVCKMFVHLGRQGTDWPAGADPGSVWVATSRSLPEEHWKLSSNPNTAMSSKQMSHYRSLEELKISWVKAEGVEQQGEGGGKQSVGNENNSSWGSGGLRGNSLTEAVKIHLLCYQVCLTWFTVWSRPFGLNVQMEQWP